MFTQLTEVQTWELVLFPGVHIVDNLGYILLINKVVMCLYINRCAIFSDELHVVLLMIKQQKSILTAQQ